GAAAVATAPDAAAARAVGTAESAACVQPVLLAVGRSGTAVTPVSGHFVRSGFSVYGRRAGTAAGGYGQCLGHTHGGVRPAAALAEGTPHADGPAAGSGTRSTARKGAGG